MPRDSKQRARLTARLRDEVFALIGCDCSEADRGGCDGPIEVDHPYGRDYIPRKLNSYNRWLRYKREALSGLIRPLCHRHNMQIKPRRVDSGERLALGSAVDAPF